MYVVRLVIIDFSRVSIDVVLRFSLLSSNAFSFPSPDICNSL